MTAETLVEAMNKISRRSLAEPVVMTMVEWNEILDLTGNQTIIL